MKYLIIFFLQKFKKSLEPTKQEHTVSLINNSRISSQTVRGKLCCNYIMHHVLITSNRKD